MAGETLQDIYVEQLKDVYSAEQQILKALPKLADAATHDGLRDAFKEHEVVTRTHVDRLERIFSQLGRPPGGHKCKGMEGLHAEGDELLDEHDESDALDAAMIAAAQRVEHYEIAGYGTVIAFAELLRENQQVSLLQETLEEEKEADKKLTELSKDINLAAQQPRAQMSEGKGQRKPGRAA